MMREGSGKVQILVSSCLLGINTRWDGGSMRDDRLVALVKLGRAVFLCPEQTGGLSTPREPSEIEPGKTAADVLTGSAKVVSKSGKDVTGEFVSGAQQILAFCQDTGITTAILKARSPSCGSQQTYDGTFEGTLRSGTGIAAELLAQNGFRVYNEENYPQALLADR